MKINEIITEDRISDIRELANNVNNLIKRDCQSYLNEIGGVTEALFNVPLYRGIPPHEIATMDMTVYDPMKQISVRSDRRSKDTPEKIHNLVDNWFLEHTDIRFRSSALFASGNLKTANIYGYPTVLIPIGNYDYCWSPNYPDLYENLEAYAPRDPGDISTSMRANINAQMQKPGMIDDFLEKGQYLVNTHLHKAIQSNNEIMIRCNSAYVIDSHWVHLIRSAMQK